MLLKRVWNRIRYKYVWKIFLCHRKFDQKSSWVLNAPNNKFYADPFLFRMKGENHLFFECKKIGKGKGVIAYAKINSDNTIGCTDTVLEEGFHLSYPYVFEDRNQVYMIPETSEDQTIRLYKSNNFPKEWECVKVLMKNVKAFDSSLIFYQDKYWLFTVIDDGRSSNPNTNLYLFYSDELESENWLSHPMNPVVSDSRLARCAGIIVVWDEILVRIAQNCDSVYGKEIQILKIDELNTRNYTEKLIRTISPNTESMIGMHTLNSNEEYCVYDARVRQKRF